jgi:ParB family chromosome partitioning protein
LRWFHQYGHGRAIINIEDQDIQTDIYAKIVSQNLSVRDTAILKKTAESLKPKPSKPKAASFEIADAQKKTKLFGTKADVKVMETVREKSQFHFT